MSVLWMTFCISNGSSLGENSHPESYSRHFSGKKA